MKQISPSSKRIKIGIDTDVYVIDANHRHVTPGLIDMHSHVGIHGWPKLWANNDVNEKTHPNAAMMRAIDALNTDDWAIPLVRAHGVTSSLILPGSSNPIAGEGVIVKLKGKSADDMVIQGGPRILKFACGENPKKVYGQRRKLPMTRMGVTWVWREKLEQARKLMNTQADWCEGSRSTRFPFNLALEPLVSLLKGTSKLHVHCYRRYDMETLMRLSKEFNFSIATFHHATEAYLMAHKLAKANIGVATWADRWGSKFEAHLASTRSPKILQSVGVDLAIHTDHPVVFSGDLLLEAAKAHHYGLPSEAAIAAVTSVPARLLGISHRVGVVRPGLDADLVIWDKHPLNLGAMPSFVIMDGKIVVRNAFNDSASARASADVFDDTIEVRGPTDVCATIRHVTLVCYAIVGVTIVPMVNGDKEVNILENGIILVQNGIVVCAESSAECENKVPKDCVRVSIAGAVAMPGMIEAIAHLGFEDIKSPARFSRRKGSKKTDGTDVPLSRAVDGIKLETRGMHAAWLAGVTVNISPPAPLRLIRGVSSSFTTCCGALIDDVLIEGRVALYLHLTPELGHSHALVEEVAMLRRLFMYVNTSDSALNNPPHFAPDVVNMVQDALSGEFFPL